MEEMEISSIQEELTKRFNAVFPDGCRRRIIFWTDPDRQFADKWNALSLENVRTVEWKPNETFRLKKLLCHDDLESNYLVYQPFEFDRIEDDWLLNVRLYSETFSADINLMWINEIGLTDTAIIRDEIKTFAKYFNAKARRDAIKALNAKSKIDNAARMRLAIMAAICGLDEAKPSKIFRAVLKAGFDKSANKIYCEFEKYGIVDSFWEMVRQGTEYVPADKDDKDDKDDGLEGFAAHLLLTATTRAVHPDCFAQAFDFFTVCERPSCKSLCYDVVSEWLSVDKTSLEDIARRLENSLNLPAVFANLSLSELESVEFFPCVNEIILDRLIQQVIEGTVDVELIRQTYEKRRILAWFDKTAHFYKALRQFANMKEFSIEHAAGFHLTDPREVWKAYENNYYKMDSYYREFHYHFKKCQSLENEQILDKLIQIAQTTAESLYVHGFLEPLCANWNLASEEYLAEFGYVPEIPKQEDFYVDFVQDRAKRISNEKTFVIVSDALRYEVAASLVDELRREYQGVVTLSSRQAIFPTETHYGMAALLPHEKIEVAETGAKRLAVSVDGLPTATLNNRENVLKHVNEASRVYGYKDFLKLRKQDRRDQFAGVSVFYFYHDSIDKAGHTSDELFFDACEKAVEDIKSVVTKLINDYKSAKIIITADHGFLYTYGDLTVDKKAPVDSFINDAVEYDRRYLITRKGAKPDYLLPVKFLKGETEYEGYAPRENVCIVKSGNVTNFVHGGVSLQETVVPVIELVSLRPTSGDYKYAKERIDTKLVTLNLASADKKITNMIFSLQFYQTEPVGPNRKKATYRLYFVDSNENPVSDENIIVADKAEEESQERVFRCQFNLRQMKFSKTEEYFLIIKADRDPSKQDQKVKKSIHVKPQKIPFQIDVPFALEEFNFFVE